MSAAASAAEPARRVRPAYVYSAAGVLLLVALVLTLAGVGERAGRLTDWQALTLGITQGVTELLPISSSGHLILVPWLANWHYLENHPDFNKTFDVALHLGTLVAVVVYFWADVVRYTGAWLTSVRRRSVTGEDQRIAWWIFAATIPTALAGAVGESTIEDRLGQPYQIAISPGCVRHPALGRRPAARGADDRPARVLDGVCGRDLADPRARPRRLALGDHDHDRAASRGSSVTRRRASRSCS